MTNKDKNSIYPEPKSYDQIEADYKRLEQLSRQHWPKFPHLNIALYGSLLTGILLWFIRSVGNWWIGGENPGTVMSGVFFSILLALAIGGLFFGWVSYVKKQYYHFTGSIGLFWLIFVMTTGLTASLWISAWMKNYSSIAWLILVVAIYFIVIFLAAKKTIDKQ